ncbi:MAG: hypothetical protein GOV02_00775 [Candidatus Aenigmarchaeota archaeon]|nr:hypothetical protein [Candidatus Aenigmarchaeota archaeon]
MIEIKFPKNIHSLTDHIIYVIHKNPDIQRQGFAFIGFTKASISNYICRLTKNGLIRNEKGILNLTAKGKADYKRIIKQPIPIAHLAKKILKVIEKEHMNITQIAQKLFPDVSRNDREKPVRLVVARLQRDNKIISIRPNANSLTFYIQGSDSKKEKEIKSLKDKMNALFILGSITSTRRHT